MAGAGVFAGQRGGRGRRGAVGMAAGAAMLGLLWLGGCAAGGEERSMSRSVELEGAESVEVSIGTKGGGKLKVSEGASGLMEADFRLRTSGLFGSAEPTVDYGIDDGRGDLNIEAPNPWVVFGSSGTETDIRLANDVPLAMDVDVGGGKGRLGLGNLDVTALDAAANGGSVGVDLSGDHPSLSRVSVEAGGGKAKVNLSGEYSSLETLDARANSGTVELDLTGGWNRDLDATIEAKGGTAVLHLPEDAGVRLTTEAGDSSVETDGLKEQDGAYVNEAYGKPGATLNIEASAAPGRVRVDTP